MTQCNGQASTSVLDHQTHVVGRDQQQEQADTDTGAVRHARGQVAQNPRAHTGGGDGSEDNPHEEDRAQRHFRRELLAQHQAEGHEGGERNRAADGDRQLGPQAHQQRAEGGGQAHRNEHGAGVKACLAEHAGHDKHGVDHCHEGGDTSHDLALLGAAACRNLEITINLIVGRRIRDASGAKFRRRRNGLFSHGGLSPGRAPR